MLTEKIAADFKEAMRSKDSARLSTLRLLKSAIEYYKIEKKQESLTDTDITAVIKKQIKQRQDSIEGFEKGGRADLVEKEKAELAVLKSYLPGRIIAGPGRRDRQGRHRRGRRHNQSRHGQGYEGRSSPDQPGAPITGW